MRAFNGLIEGKCHLCLICSRKDFACIHYNRTPYNLNIQYIIVTCQILICNSFRIIYRQFTSHGLLGLNPNTVAFTVSPTRAVWGLKQYLSTITLSSQEEVFLS